MEQESQVELSDDFGGFPADVVEDVDGLMWLGYLEDEFNFCGHHFVIRTLRGDEELLAGSVCKEYTEQIGQDKAFTWATVALALVAVDGDEDFCPPIGRDKPSYARARFQYCSSKWFWPLAFAVFKRYTALQARQAEAIRVVEDLFEGSLPTSTSFADSLIGKDDFEPPEDILEYLDDSTESSNDA